MRVEAQRDYLLALRSAVENPDLHQRILESQFLSTLLRLKKNPTRKRNGGAENSNAKPQGDLIVAALCSEVLGYICHSPHEEVLTKLLLSGGIKMLVNFATDAARHTRGYSIRTLQIICIASSALTSMSRLSRAPAYFARANVIVHMHNWVRNTGGKNMHLCECYSNMLTNIACATPKSHPTFWLEPLMYAVCDEFVLRDGSDANSRHLCLQATQTLLRVIEITSVPVRITKGNHHVIAHCLNLIRNAETIWKVEFYKDWKALVHAVTAIFYVISCSSKAIGSVCDPGEEPVMPLICKLVKIGFSEPNMAEDLHSSCIAIIGNIARVVRLRSMLLKGEAVQIIMRW